MSEISFGSTYRVKITQAGTTPSKKQKLRELMQDYNGLIGNGTDGYARVSILNKEDNIFVQKLKALGYKIFQRFKGEKVNNNGIDAYIQRCLNNREFEQFGVQKNKLSKAYKEKIKLRKDLSDTASTQKQNKQLETLPKQSKEALIRTGADYIRIKNEHGEEAAEFIFFGIK